MLMIGIAGLELATNERDWLKAPGVCGVLLFGRNFASREQVTALIESIRDVAGEDFLVAVDQEGGPVQRFREGFTRLPPLAAIGRVYDRDLDDAIRLAEEHAWVMASEMRAIGVDFSFAPVVDLARGNAAIGLRAFHAIRRWPPNWARLMCVACTWAVWPRCSSTFRGMAPSPPTRTRRRRSTRVRWTRSVVRTCDRLPNASTPALRR